MPDVTTPSTGRPVYIVDGARTPQLKAKGAPGPFSAADLAVGAGRPMPLRTPAWTVQRNCASGMQAIDSAFHDIAAGRADLVLAGGVESMSRAPVLLSDAMVTWLAHWNAARGVGARARTLTKLRPAYLAPVSGLLRGLTDPLVGLNMGQTAENLANRIGISREELDAYALESHRRQADAQDQGPLGEIEIIYDNAGKVYG